MEQIGILTKIERDLDQRITEIEDGRTGRTLKLNYLNQTNLLDKIEGLEEEISFSDYDRLSPKKTVVGPEDKPLVKREVTYHPDHPFSRMLGLESVFSEKFEVLLREGQLFRDSQVITGKEIHQVG